MAAPPVEDTVALLVEDMAGPPVEDTAVPSVEDTAARNSSKPQRVEDTVVVHRSSKRITSDRSQDPQLDGFWTGSCANYTGAEVSC